ncbi:acyltransferase family protein [Ensifer adhaerens]
MQYRTEIDGLRALAVLAVLLFHADFSFIPGGFAGVDVFFVISGYLITTIIDREIREGSFSLFEFYRRRIKRIAPAVFFVCAVCVPFAWYWMLPRELNAFGRSLYYVALSASNFLFWQETDYFSASNELKPLLHTWSLAVEEQFYIVFPLLLLGLKTRHQAARHAVIGLTVAMSFAASLVMPLFDPAANFYLLPSRFWELGAGAALALVGPIGAVSGVRREALAILGLVLIAGSCGILRSVMPYPGTATLPVVAGTVLVLAFATKGTFVAKLLSCRVLVTTGLCSYSLYLWHQPVFAFARLRSQADLSSPEYVVLILLCFLLAYVTYHFIEKPFRMRHSLPAKRAFGAAAAFGGALVCVGGTIDNADGFPSRVPALARITELSAGLDRKCNGYFLPQCQTSDAPTVAVWGDSFAMHLVDGILASNAGAEIIQLNMHACGPFFDLAPVVAGKTEKWRHDCLEHNRRVREVLSSQKSIRYVILSSPFRQYLDAEKVHVRGPGLLPSNPELVLASLQETLAWIRSIGKLPVIFEPPPRSGKDSALCQARASLIGSAVDCRLVVKDVHSYDEYVQLLMGRVSMDYPVVSIREYLCDDAFCQVELNGVSLFQDDGHFSRQGSRKLGKLLNFYGEAVRAAEGACVGTSAGVSPSGICQMRPDETPEPVMHPSSQDTSKEATAQDQRRS